ncbi:MAG: 1-deoxy-D-xylulose-5-phosphate reductoisomerase, partial [Clostridiaceae bacterium]|nr:1-deoxy-D-xylulose-5-phosphate reductoisomerase [Clostridiaceae bacterium]
RIEVIVHPQSIIHSMVQFVDGSIKAQMGLPDMKLPIQYAFTYPERVQTNFSRMDFNLYPYFTFEKPDLERFRNLGFAYKAIEEGGNMPCILNAANEVAVEAFLKSQIGFLDMSDVIESVMSTMAFIRKPAYEDYVKTDKEARLKAQEKVAEISR